MIDNFKILIACEESQAVTSSLLKLGWDAYSCDIQPCSGQHKDRHIVGCALKEAYSGKYDMMIAFPPCTYLSNVGTPHLMRGGVLNLPRYYKGMDAYDFFMSLYNAPIRYKAIENPTPSKAFGLPPYTQAIQPYEHGHVYTKRTCLWLRNLPLLIPTHNVTPCKGGWTETTRNPKMRSKTFQGIADAMASQWTNYILKQHSTLSL